MIKLGSNSIGKIYLGSNSIGKAYLGSNLVYQSGGFQPTQPIPYIRGGGSGGSYIDTGITADNTVRVVVWARNWNPGGTFLFGSRIAASDSAFFIAAPSVSSGNTHVGGIQIGYGASNSTYADDTFGLMGGYHKYELYQGVLKVDDVTVATGETSTFSNSLNIHIIGINNNGTHGNSMYPIDICKVEIWKNGTLVRNLTPVDSPSVGMYDSVNDTVLTNAGSGSLTYGTFDMTGYTPLQYVECQSAAYIDTGIKGSYSLRIIAKFQPSSANTGYKFLLGGRTSTTSARCDFQIGDSSTANKGYYFGYQTASNTVYDSASQTGNDLVWVKNNNTSTLYKSGTQLGTVTGASGDSFTTTYNMYIGALNNAGTATSGFRGRIYYVSMGSDGNFIPMLHNGVAGLYDTYSDTFKPSLSANDFVAGPTI